MKVKVCWISQWIESESVNMFVFGVKLKVKENVNVRVLS